MDSLGPSGNAGHLGVTDVGHQNSICVLNQVVAVHKNESTFPLVMVVLAYFGGLLLPRHRLSLENVALRQQLTVLEVQPETVAPGVGPASFSSGAGDPNVVNPEGHRSAVKFDN